MAYATEIRAQLVTDDTSEAEIEPSLRLKALAELELRKREASIVDAKTATATDATATVIDATNKFRWQGSPLQLTLFEMRPSMIMAEGQPGEEPIKAAAFAVKIDRCLRSVMEYVDDGMPSFMIGRTTWVYYSQAFDWFRKHPGVHRRNRPVEVKKPVKNQRMLKARKSS